MNYTYAENYYAASINNLFLLSFVIVVIHARLGEKEEEKLPSFSCISLDLTQLCV